MIMKHNKQIFSYRNRFGTTINVTSLLEFIAPALVGIDKINTTAQSIVTIRSSVNNIYLSDILMEIIEFVKNYERQ